MSFLSDQAISIYSSMQKATKYCVVGGGISGVSCAQELVRLHGHSAHVTLLTESETIIGAASIFRVTDHLHELKVFERTTDNFKESDPLITIVKCFVEEIDYEKHSIHVKDRQENKLQFEYDKLCISMGARPKLILDHPNVIGLRDQHSVEELLQRLCSARTVVIVGNGGIALELVNELTFCNVEWVIKSDYIGSAFFDASASAFILPQLQLRAERSASGSETSAVPASGAQASAADKTPTVASAVGGAALGPEWVAKTAVKHFLNEKRDLLMAGNLQIHKQQEIAAVSSDGGRTWIACPGTVEKGGSFCVGGAAAESSSEAAARISVTDFPLLLRTTAGKVIGCDFLISATGVEPRHEAFVRSTSLPAPATLPIPEASTTEGALPFLQLSVDGYICVDEQLRTSVQDVFAAGDCCHYPTTCNSGPSVGRYAKHFFQMRLWTQAYWMGIYAAQGMSGRGDDFGIDGKFELFAHVTRFFGYKVVMLGRYNAQGLGDVAEAVTKGLVVSADGVHYAVDGPSPPTTTPEESSTGTSTSTSQRGTPPLEIWLRVIPGREYIKLTVLRGKIVGALLIGDTDLEETCENLILNALDVGGIGIGMLDPSVDIEDYFD